MSLAEVSTRAARRTDLSVCDSRQVLCLLNTMDGPWSTAYEFHYPLEMGIMLRGRMRRIFSRDDVTLEPGEIWFCGMWEPHGYEIVERPCHRVVLMLHPPLVAETRFEELPGVNWMLPFTVTPKARPRVDAKLRDEMLQMARRLCAASETHGAWQQVQLRLLFWETLLKVTRSWLASSQARAGCPGDFERVKRAVDMVFDSRQRVNTQQAAALCGLSRNRFSVIFREAMGITFSDFALRYRLSRAARQLACGDDPLKAIARNWGFTDESHLCRSFKSHYGVTPAEYRRQATGADVAGDCTDRRLS